MLYWQLSLCLDNTYSICLSSGVLELAMPLAKDSKPVIKNVPIIIIKVIVLMGFERFITRVLNVLITNNTANIHQIT